MLRPGIFAFPFISNTVSACVIFLSIGCTVRQLYDTLRLQPMDDEAGSDYDGSTQIKRWCFIGRMFFALVRLYGE